jgi:uncharacterized membrane protein YhhN
LNAWLLLLSAAALVCGALHVRADERGALGRTFVFKPLTTSLILLVAALAPEPVSPLYRGLVVAGLAFSLAGDVFLMLPSDRFREGLSSFLVAHLLYVTAFVSSAGFQPAPWVLLGFVAAAGSLYRALWPALGALKLPVAVYVLAIGAMCWQAGGRWLLLGSEGALLAFAGAVLFAVSDATLAWNRFRSPLPHAQRLVLGTYYPAQLLIAWSAVGP